MAVVGTATINITPKFPGFSQQVTSALSGINTTSLGQQAGAGYSSGLSGSLVKSGAVVGAFSAITTSALNAISSHISDAVSRFDTLNNYSIVMENLGFSSETAEASIQKMSDRLIGLPTALNDMASTVTGLSAVVDDLDLATDAGLALNDMLIASGSSTTLANAAMEQFRQMLSKGKPDMQDWKSIVQAMPAQMKQLAEEMLGAGSTATDLYNALGGGGNEAIISTEELLNAMVALDTEGSESITSFQEQAEAASGGIQTQMANLGNAVTRGLTSVLDAIGKDTITDVFTDAREAINDFFSGVSGVVSKIGPSISGVVKLIEQLAPAAVGAGAGLTIFSKISGTVSKLTPLYNELKAAAEEAGEETTKFGLASQTVIQAMNPTAIAVGIGAAAIGMFAAAMMDALQKQADFEAATEGLSDAVNRSTGLSSFSGTISDIGKSAQATKEEIDDLSESIADHANTIIENTNEAEAQLSTLNTAQSVIAEYAGQQDLSTDAAGRLQWALEQVNDQFGLSLTAADVAKGKYKDEEGAVQDLKQSVEDLIAAKKQEIKIDTLTENLEEAYQAQEEAQEAYADFINLYRDEIAQFAEHNDMSFTDAAAVYGGGDKLLAQVETAGDAVEKLEAELGDASIATSESADAFDKWGNSLSATFLGILEGSGGSLSALKEDLRTLGVNTDELAALSEEDLTNIALAYDGTAQSLTDVLAGVGVAIQGVDESTQSFLERMSGLELGEVDTAQFAQSLDNAGISIEELKSVGSANLSTLAQNCNGNIDLMIAALANYDGVTLNDKYASVSLNDNELIDALGNIYTYDGVALYDKDGTVVVDDKQLTNANGEIVTWKNKKLESKSASAKVTSNIDDITSDIGTYNSTSLKNKSATVTITEKTIKTTTTKSSSEKSASGGFVFHAAGGIATSAITYANMANHIIGEDGAEAIVPLTNRKYAQPFINMLAEGINNQRQGSTGNTYIINGITYGDTDLRISEAIGSLVRAARITERA